MTHRLLCALIAWISTGVSALAQTTAHEAFDYSLGNNLTGLNGGIGFSGPYLRANEGVVDFTIGAGLNYPGLAVSGNSLFASNFAKDYRLLSLPAGQNYGTSNGTLFASFLIKPAAAPIDISLNDPITESYGGFAFAGQTPLNGGTAQLFIGGIQGRYGIEPYGGGGSQSSSVATTGEVTLLVVRMIFQQGLDQIDLFVNPNLTGWNTSTPANATFATELNFNQIYIEQWQRNYLLDEFHMGTSFASVVPLDPVAAVPEPSTYALGAMGVLTLLVAQRRRAREALLLLLRKNGDLA